MKAKKITVLVDKVDFETYRTLKRDNIYPLIVKTDSFDIFSDEAYCMYGKLYKLKIQYLKENWERRTKQGKNFDEQDNLKFSNGNRFPILRIAEAFESKEKEDGFVIKTSVGTRFISMEDLIKQALGIEKQTEEEKKEADQLNSEKVTICEKVADFHSYEIMRSNHALPMVVVLTEFQNKVVSVPFDDLYIKANIPYKGKSVMTLNLTLLTKMITEGKIDLEGFRLKNGEVHKVDEMLGGDYDSLGTISIGEQNIDVKKYTKELLEPKEFKLSQSNPKAEEFYLY